MSDKPKRGKPLPKGLPYDPTRVPKKTGRPSKLTVELIEKVTELVKAGNYVEVACAASSISQASFYKWLQKARDIVAAYGDDAEEWPEDVTEHEALCVHFMESLKLAQAESEAYAVTIVRKAMTSNWTAAMTYLERRYPGRWKRRDEHTVGNPFEIAAAQNQSGIDEQALLNDPEAQRLMHEALEHIARGELEAGGDIVDADVVEDSTDDA